MICFLGALDRICHLIFALPRFSIGLLRTSSYRLIMRFQLYALSIIPYILKDEQWNMLKSLLTKLLR